MKIKKLVFASALSAAMLLGACAKQAPTLDLKGEYDVTLWVSETTGVAELFESQITAFEEANPGIVINETIEKVSESESATQMLTNVDEGADIYCFAQDQFARLVQGGALSKLGNAAGEAVKKANEGGAVKAATSGKYLFAYPLTSDNGYFMYYDKSVIQESHINSLEDLIADCEAASRFFSFELEGSAWYNASFFFGTGCVSEWVTDDNGKFIDVHDTFNSNNGLIAAKGMQKLLQSTAYNNSSKAADFTADTPSAIVVSGTWDANVAKAALGANLGVAKLPEFEVGDKSYQIGSFSGCKLLGVKPQSDVKRSAVLHKLATYLTNEECQLARFKEVGWGPSNLNAQKSEDVKADPILSALFEQNNFAVPQGQIHGSWWDIAKVIATGIRTAKTGDDKELKAVLEKYAQDLDDLFHVSEDVKNAFTVIGEFAVPPTADWANWSTDLPMTKNENVWTSAPITLTEGDAFKVRKGKSWDEAYPASNYVVSAAEAGSGKVVQLTVTDAGAEVAILTAN